MSNKYKGKVENHLKSLHLWEVAEDDGHYLIVVRYAVGIRFVPGARKYIYGSNADDDARCFEDFCAFQTLYVILNEEDSLELYLDEQGRLLKLDNAAAFNLEGYAIALFNIGEQSIARTMIESKLIFTEYDKYGIMLSILTERYRAAGEKASLSMFVRFAALEETCLYDAFETLNEVYPAELSDYYRKFGVYARLCAKVLSVAIRRKRKLELYRT